MTAFSFDLDPSTRRLTITLSGFWDMAVMDAYERAFGDTMRRLRSFGPGTSCLVDGSRYVVQSKEIMARHEALMAANVDLWADRVALAVSTEGLPKRQAERVAPDRPLAVFTSVADAEAWLDGLAAD